MPFYNNPLALDGINFRLLSGFKEYRKMASYLLLRDNKESGPFTVDDLLHSGLKPYDLVWVQGKSAAWRYPSEVEELKPFAPVVEEQPFDRFYKKNKEEKKPETPVSNEQERYAAPVVKEEELKFIPKKSVFVTLPDQKQVAVKKNIQPVKETATPSPIISITENPPVAEIKYSQPLDEIKEMYVKTLQQRKDKNAKKGFLIGMLKKVAVFGGLLVLGVLTGFIIKSKSGKPDNVIQQKKLQASPLVNNPAIDESASASLQKKESASVDQPARTIQNDDPAISKKTEEPEKYNQEPTVRIRKETMLIVPKRKQEFDTRQVAPDTEMNINAITGERERKTRNNSFGMEEKAIVKSNKNNLKDQVSVASNDYKRVAFGGIRNLYLTVTNNSKYELDNVVVELQYLKPSEEPLRTENIKFRSIAPNASSTIRVPDTNRGIKVGYKIINIDSKQNSDAVAGM